MKKSHTLPSMMVKMTAVVSFLLLLNGWAAGQCSGNLLSNPGFESNMNSWNNLSGGSIVTDAHNGSKALKVCGTTNGPDYRIIQAVPHTGRNNLRPKCLCQKSSGAARPST